MLRRIDHLGIAVRSLDEAIPFYRDVLGLAFGAIEDVSSYRVRVAFFHVGGVKLELLEPSANDGPIAEFLAARGPGLHHVAYEVEDIETAIRECEARGARMIDRAPRPGAHGARVAFLDPASSGSVVTELLELPPRAPRTEAAEVGRHEPGDVLRRLR